MNFIKSNLKLIIGICAICLVVMIFFVTLRAQQNLEDGDLRNWTTASESRRLATAEIMGGSAETAELMSGCITKMASLPDSGRFKIRDAASLCAVGIALRDAQ
ncbi:MAG: hypothetical protein FWE52_00650 [Alphaproteobacteria bacterium]|nr:hypothetical protein [Alphaproteobacteria bacterium]